MKALIAVCLLLSPAVAQNIAPVQMESQVPSLSLSFSGQQAGSYKFKVINQSGHAITAFAVLLVPAGIQKVDGRYACGASCGRSIRLADNAHPAIKAGAAAELSFPISTVNGGALVAEAAIFDDASYEGGEKAAAFLVAEQIGRQVEYDRLIAAVNSAMTGADDARKTTQIRARLGEVSVNIDFLMIQTFKRGFPDLAACAQQYARFMKAAAVSEKNLVTTSMEQFAHGTAPGKPSLDQWWAAMQQQLGGFGCNGCTLRAVKAERPASAQNAVQGCTTEDIPPTTLLASTPADDGSQPDAAALDPEDMDLAADLSDEDEAVLDADAGDVAPYTRPKSPPATNAAAKPVEPTPQPSPAIALPLQPAKRAAEVLHGRCLAPDGKTVLVLCRMTFTRDTQDDVVYRAVFRDIGDAGDLALQEDVRLDANGQLVGNSGPKAGGLTDVQIALLKQVATQCNQQLADLGTKVNILLRTSFAGYPPGWLVYAPPLPELESLKEQETATLDRAIARLRLRLGSSFSTLEKFVDRVYRTSTLKMVPVKLSPDAEYFFYLHYFAMLDNLAPENPLARKEEAWRQHELSKAGLDESARAVVLKVALDYEKQTPPVLPMTGHVMLPGPGQAVLATSAQVNAPGQMAVGAQRIGGLPSTGAAPGAAMPILPAARAGLMQSTGGLEPAEMERRRDEAQLNILSHIAQLRAGMSPAMFQNLDAYVRALYKKAGWHKAVTTVAVATTAAATGK